MAMPPCSWIAAWPICRANSLTCTFAAAIAVWRSAASGASASIAAYIAIDRACSSATSMSAARCCNA